MTGRRLRILLLSTFDGRNANVIADYLFAFNAYSRHEYTYVFDCRLLDGESDFPRYDVIVLFWSLYLLGPSLSEAARDAIAAAPALKVLLLQDEYRDVRAINAAMARLGVQVMLTCVAERDHSLFYPRSLVPSLEGVYTVLTGYVPTYLERVRPLERELRALDIGYRSRAVPFHLGDLGQEKTRIAEAFARLAWENGLRYDISVREEDRIYGRGWLRFLRSCRFTLGSGSGASVVDFNGEIRRRCDDHLAAHPQAGYAEVKALHFADVDGKVVIDTISPRIFEAVAFGATPILHDGPYAGLLVADVHYLAVRKDHSNLAEVVSAMHDDGYCRAVAERARRDLIDSGAYSYRAFTARFDSILEHHRPTRVAGGRRWRPLRYAADYLRHDQAIIPRGASFVRLPSRRGFERALLWPLLLISRGRSAWRAALRREPLQAVGKAAVAVARTLTEPAFARLAAAYLVSREARRATPAGNVLGELLRLSLIRDARAGRLTAGRPFTVEVETVPPSCELRLASRPAAAWGATADSEPDGRAIEWLLAGGVIDTAHWDHSAIGTFVPLPLTRTRWLVIRIGDAGVQSLAGLAALGRHLPLATARAWRAALAPPRVAASGGEAYAPASGQPPSAEGPVRTPLLRPLLRRAAGSPRTAAKGAVAVLVTVASGRLRALLIGWLRDPGCRRAVRPDGLLEDLLRLAVLRRARGGRDAGPHAKVAIRASLEREGEELVFRTSPAGAGPGAAVEEPPLDVSRVRALHRIVWDHSAVAASLRCPLVGSAGLSIALEGTGVYHFRSLSALAARLPAELLRALEP